MFQVELTLITNDYSMIKIFFFNFDNDLCKQEANTKKIEWRNWIKNIKRKRKRVENWLKIKISIHNSNIFFFFMDKK